jgi:16S rRNA (uracil1498-N3)-methyltransferase
MANEHADWVRTPRLYLADQLQKGARIRLTGDQAHYLLHVRRARAGERFRIFNGEDGEWSCLIEEIGRRHVSLSCDELLRSPVPPPDIDYLFAPLKSARLDYLAQKATEMGVRRLRPVLTRRTISTRVNLDRLRANVIEAAEQCNLVWLPEVAEPAGLDAVLDRWEYGRRLIYCDEHAPIADAITALKTLPAGPIAVLIGPEGGFAPEERRQLSGLPFVTPISLGPRVLRSDTAAVAALAVVQSVLGDWR